MTALLTDDPVLRRYKAALEGLYGDQIDRIVLFGSRARGDAHADSDYEIAVFLKSMPDRWVELAPWKGTASASALAIAVGCIAYPGGGTGKILYLKPSFLAELPADVMSYGRSDETFPHGSTANQWFSESQFESYGRSGGGTSISSTRVCWKICLRWPAQRLHA